MMHAVIQCKGGYTIKWLGGINTGRSETTKKEDVIFVNKWGTQPCHVLVKPFNPNLC